MYFLTSFPYPVPVEVEELERSEISDLGRYCSSQPVGFQVKLPKGLKIPDLRRDGSRQAVV